MAQRRALLLAAAALPLASLPALALDAPSGATVLSVSGKLQITNDGSRAHFDMRMLEAMPQISFTTASPWYKQPRRFTGPRLRDVVASVGGQGAVLRLVALNDYRVDMPFEDAQRHDVVVARLLDDKPMAVRDKGPLFVIYPFDARPELRSAIYYSRCAWQLRNIEVM